MRTNNTTIVSIFRGVIILLINLVAWWAIPVGIASPDILVMCGILLGFFIVSPSLLAVFLFTEVVLMNFSPFFSLEWLYVIGAGMAVFVIMRLFIFKRTVFVVGILAALAEVLFWIMFGGISSLASVMFIEVLLYSILWSGIVYTLLIWLEKKYL